MENFLLQNVVRADIFPVLWQFLKNAASPLAGEPQITGAFPRRLRRRKMFELISIYAASKEKSSFPPRRFAARRPN